MTNKIVPIKIKTTEGTIVQNGWTTSTPGLFIHCDLANPQLFTITTASGLKLQDSIPSFEVANNITSKISKIIKNWSSIKRATDVTMQEYNAIQRVLKA